MPSSTHESASSDMSMQNNVSVASGPTKVRTPWSEFWRKFKRQRMTLFAGSFIGLLVLIAIFWPWLVPYDPENYFDYDMLNAGPSLQHWFGVDSLGRDIFSRILAGARISLAAGFSSVLVGAVVGTLLGLTSGYFEGWWDRVVMRVCDVLFAFPGILLAISVVAVLGSGMANVILAVAICILFRYVECWPPALSGVDSQRARHFAIISLGRFFLRAGWRGCRDAAWPPPGKLL